MAIPESKTVRELIACSYANLARAHAALEEGALAYKVLHHMIRSRLYHGLISGTMSIRSIFDDERIKMTAPQACCYCGSRLNLAIDHLVPRTRGAVDEADNLVLACRPCNSSKQGRDMLAWMKTKGMFPSILILRRYLKIVARFCERQGCMDADLSGVPTLGMPFDLLQLPTKFPPLSGLKLWVYPDGE
jgi:hypothetical protein